MTFVYLALCLAIGVLAGDAGCSGLPSGSRPVFLGLLSLILLALWWRLGRGGLIATWGLRIAALLAAGAVLFDVGSSGLQARLDSAAEDALRAASAANAGPRLIEARVVGRRTGRWADEVELAGVRAADGGAALPSRILLRIPRFGEGTGRPSVVRADPGGGVLDSIAGDEGTLPETRTRADALLWPGARVRLGVRIAPLFFARNPGAPDREREAARRGWAARGRLADPAWVVTLAQWEGSLARMADRAGALRARLRLRVAERVASFGDGAALARALALGDRSALSGVTRDAFARSGLSHLIAVSGFHVGLVAGVFGWLALKSGLPARFAIDDPFVVTFAAGVGAAALYAWLTGAGAATQRAWWGLLAVGLIGRLGGPRAPLPLLACVGGAMSVIEPAMLFDPGAQLSFAACTGLILAGVWREAEKGAVPRSFGRGPPDSWPRRFVALSIDGARASLAVSTAACFGVVSILVSRGMASTWLAPLCNLVAIPWLGLVALPSALISVGLAGVLPTGAVGDFVLNLGIWPSRILSAAVVEAAARLPEGPVFEVRSLWPVGLGAAAGIFLLRSGRLASASLLWCLVSTCTSMPPPTWIALGERPGLWFFDVGQGDATLLVGRSAVVLVDTGPGSPDGEGGRGLVRTLRALGHRRLDLLVVTHGDLDHRGGARRLLEELEVETLWLPLPGRSDPVLRDLEERARAVGTSVVWTDSEGESWHRGELSLEVLWPPRAGAPTSRNDASLVIRAMVDKASVLLTADAGAAIERRLLETRRASLAADILKVSHHGSGGGSSTAFLEAVAPTHAIVSAPCLPTRGLPNRDALARIRAGASQLWWTGRDGAVYVGFDARRAVAGGGPGSAEERGEERRIRVSGWGRPRVCGPGESLPARPT